MNVSCAVEDSEIDDAEGKVSVMEGRYIVCCVLEKKLKKREECGLGTAWCEVGRIAVFLLR